MPFATVTLASAGFDVPTLNAEDFEGTRHAAYRSYTHASGADTGEVDLLKLPAGRIKVYSIASHVQTSQFAAGALMDIGTRAYTHEDGTDVAEDPDRFALDLAAGAAAIDEFLPLPNTGAGVSELNSQNGITVFATIDTGNIEDGDTIDLVVEYSKIA